MTIEEIKKTLSDGKAVEYATADEHGDETTVQITNEDLFELRMCVNCQGMTDIIATCQNCGSNIFINVTLLMTKDGKMEIFADEETSKLIKEFKK